MKKQALVFLSFVVVLLMRLACSLPGGLAPAAVSMETAIAQTVAAELTHAALSATPAISETAPQRTRVVRGTVTPTPTSTATPTGTLLPPTITFTATNTQAPCNRARFIADVNYPDNTEVQANTPFVKTWSIRNTGSCTWDAGYQLIFAGGDQMSAPASLPLAAGAVSPGSTTNVSVNLVAPGGEGTYTGNFRFRAADGTVFGVENSTGGDIWVRIRVPAPASSGGGSGGSSGGGSEPEPEEPPAVVQQPDLIVSEIKLNPASPIQGQPVNVRVYAYNKGTKATSQFTLAWWGLDSFANPSCTWDVMDTISPGGGRGYDCTFTFASWYPANKTTKAVVDTTNHVVESDETNNVKTQPITVLKP